MKRSRWIPLLFLTLSLVVAGCGRLPGLATPTRRPLATVAAPIGSDVRITGVVRENYLGCEVDNVCMLEVDVGGGVLHVLYDYGEGERRCENRAIFAQASSLESGDRVEILAEVTASGNLSACDAGRYHIRKIP